LIRKLIALIKMIFIIVMIMVNSITNRFLKIDKSMKIFFISIMGPYTRKPIIEKSEKVP